MQRHVIILIINRFK